MSLFWNDVHGTTIQTSRDIYIPSVGETFKLPLNHEIDDYKFENFVSNSDDSVKDLVRKIRYNTKHVSYSEFISNFILNVNKILALYRSLNLHTTNRPIYIMIGKYFQKKSNYWLLLYLINHFNTNGIDIKIMIIVEEILNTTNINSNNIYIEHQIQEVVVNPDLKIRAHDLVLFIDDCIYSGTQMGTNIENLLASMVKLPKEFMKTIHICLLCSYISTKGYENILNIFIRKNYILVQSNILIQLYINGNFHYYKEFIDLPLINNYFTIDEIALLSSYYGVKIENLDKDNNTFLNKYLIYFDHKLADFVSTIPLFYSGVILNEYNKNIISREGQGLSYNDFIYNKSCNYQMQPFINNCYLKYLGPDRYGNPLGECIKIDISKPNCPITPYKR